MKNKDFDKNWGFQEGYFDRIKEIIESNLSRIVSITVSTPEEDMKNAFDFKVESNSGHIAVRVRRGDCSYRDITIRSYNKGYKTELEKITEGYGDFYLYAWENSSQTDIQEWVLIDLNKSRDMIVFEKYFRKEIPNYDGGATRFMAFDISEFNDCNAVVSYNMDKKYITTKTYNQ